MIFFVKYIDNTLTIIYILITLSNKRHNMKNKKSIQLRVLIGLEKGQNRIRCIENEFEEAAKFGVRDPFRKNRFVAAFSVYEDTNGGFFAYFSESFMIAARKVWGIVQNEQNKQSGKNT